MDSHDAAASAAIPVPAPTPEESLLLRFVRELPRLPSGSDLGVATAGVTPWPHQLRVVRRVVERFPQSYLFSDEVGLGKTVEAALALRQLWLSGRVTRALVLVPRAVLRQWHEELHEKAALPFARLEGDQFFDVTGEPLEASEDDANAWNRHDLVLASSQLARGRGRRRELLAAGRWDLVVVDEAHHARRRQLPGPYRPNRLLELLDGAPGEPGLRQRTRALYLLTATPMQIHPLEVFDLLRLLGLGGRWGGDESAFLGYFEQLRRPFAERDWPLLLELAAEGRRPAPAAATPLLAAGAGKGAAASLGAAERREVDAWLRRSTPVGELVWRHTRPVLRRYRELGLLDAGVPERRPRNVWIELSPDQRRLYRRIESYLAEFYQRYEARRPGLGFVMTVFRRRLTSSFAAVRASLERRRATLTGQGPAAPEDAGLDLESMIAGEQQELALGPEEAGALPTPSAYSRDELEHLDTLLEALGELPDEPKLRRLEKDLRRLLRRRDRVLVFTQYLDTLDELRDALRGEWRVACYSGRGGEVWSEEESAFVPGEKEALKDAFGRGEIQVLLCTEAASEGLNLQTCGVLINYDMPWNPMRVEQRIGRIDRIGQRHRRVWIRNYFYSDTVESAIYLRLADRIDWFQSVVGELQPILHRVGEAVESLAMTPESRRRRRLEEDLADLRRRLDEAPADPVGEGGASSALDDPDLASELEAVRAPMTPRELEEIFVSSAAFGDAFEATGEQGVFRLVHEGKTHRVTFEPSLFAERPYSLALLTWGTPLFEALLATAPAPPASDEPSGLGLYSSRNPAPVSVFAAPVPGEDGVAEVPDLDALRRLLAAPPGRWSGDEEARAASLFSRRRRRVLEGLQEVEAVRRRAEKKALRATAGELLIQAAALELIAAENPGLFDEPPDYTWGEGAVAAQARRPGPYARLVALAEDGLAARPDAPAVEELRGRSPERLARRALEVERRGYQVLERWQLLSEADEAARRVVTDVSSGLLDRLYFPLAGGADEAAWPPVVEGPELEPFRNAVPLWSTVGEAAADLVGVLAEGRDPLAEAASRPERHTWIALEGRVLPGPDLFAAHVHGRALEPRVPEGAIGVFRLDTGPPRDGQLVLLDGVSDPETGEGAVVRRWRWHKRRRQPPSLRLEALALDLAPIVIEEPEEAGLRLLARLVDVVERSP